MTMPEPNELSRVPIRVTLDRKTIADVPIVQCVELVNAALAYREARKAHTAVWSADGDGYSEEDEDRIGVEYATTYTNLAKAIEALPDIVEIV